MNPSAFSVSSAYITSARLASIFGNGRLAKAPNRLGCRWRSVAAASLQSRATRTGSAILGTDDTDRMPSAIPAASIIAIALSGDQSGARLSGICAANTSMPTAST